VKLILLIKDELADLEQVGGDLDVWVRLLGVLPSGVQGLPKQFWEVVNVGGAGQVGGVALGLKPLLGRVRGVKGLSVKRTPFCDYSYVRNMVTFSFSQRTTTKHKRLTGNKDVLASVVLGLAICVYIQDKACHVADNEANRVGRGAGCLLDHELDLA